MNLPITVKLTLAETQCMYAMICSESAEQHTLTVSEQLVVPIPPNYGRIGWNGSFLTVS